MFDNKIFPDEGITVGEMKEYGYKWPGMLPVRFMTDRMYVKKRRMTAVGTAGYR